MSEWSHSGDHCAICSNTLNVSIFNPQTNRDDPVVSFFAGKNLCRICGHTMLLNANAGDEARSTDPGVFALGIRSQTAYYIQFNPSKLTGRMNILCEACLRNDATRLEPGTKLIDDLENLSEYRGKFYCEKCSDPEVQNRARAHESLSGNHCAICSNTLSVSIFHPRTPNAEADPLMSSFIGAKLCEECVSTLVSECAKDPDEEERIGDESRFILFIRTLIATKFIGRPESQSRGRFVCEVCWKKEATNVHPGMFIGEGYPYYYSRFFCEECVKSRTHNPLDYFNEARNNPVAAMIDDAIWTGLPSNFSPVHPEKRAEDRCFICANTEDIAVFNPEKERDDPLMSFFTGRNLCKYCVKALVTNCEITDDDARISEPSQFVVGVRSRIAYLIQYEPSKLPPREIVCETCGKDEATKLEPGTKLRPNWDENFTLYRGDFYCEKCYADRARSTEFFLPKVERPSEEEIEY